MTLTHSLTHSQGARFGVRVTQGRGDDAQPLQGQLSLLADTDDHDERLNVFEGRYQAHSGIVADDAGACSAGVFSRYERGHGAGVVSGALRL